MRPQLEKDIEKDCVQYAKRRGAASYKFVSPSNRGVPDRVFVWQGVTFFTEFKRLGAKPTKLQRRKIREINEAGGIAFWCDNFDIFRDLSHAILYDDDFTVPEAHT